MVDADIGLRNLDVILGLENRIVFNVVDVAKKICKPAQAIIKSKKSNNLFLLPASQTDDKDVIDEGEVRYVLEQFKREFHYILVDSPAGIEQGFRNACAGADSAIVVTTPEVSAIRDADRVIGLLSSKGIEPRLIINRIDFDMVKRGDMLSVKDVQDILGIEIVGLLSAMSRLSLLPIVVSQLPTILSPRQDRHSPASQVGFVESLFQYQP